MPRIFICDHSLATDLPLSSNQYFDETLTPKVGPSFLLEKWKQSRKIPINHNYVRYYSFLITIITIITITIFIFLFGPFELSVHP